MPLVGSSRQRTSEKLVAVEIADTSGHQPAGCVAEIRARRPVAVRDQPDVGVAGGGVEPDDIAGAVLVESRRCRPAPSRPDACRWSCCRPTGRCRASRCRFTVAGLYQSTSLVPSLLKSPTPTMSAGGCKPIVVLAGPLAVDQAPDVGVARRRIVPEHVAGAVGVEVADAGDVVAGRMHADRGAAGPLAVFRSRCRCRGSPGCTTARRWCRRR